MRGRAAFLLYFGERHLQQVAESPSLVHLGGPLMTEQTKRARRLAILMACVSGLFGCFNLSGRVVYAQYNYCSLSCSATAPAEGAAGAAISFSVNASTNYCEGSPSYAWNFGDGAAGSGSSASHSYAAAGNYIWS